MKTAGELHNDVCLRGVSNYTNNELKEICQQIMIAPGNRACAIAASRRHGWWDCSVAEPCQAIMDAPGDRALAIAIAKTDDWWDDSVAEPCQAIMDAPGDRAWAINHAKQYNWWKQPNLSDEFDDRVNFIMSTNPDALCEKSILPDSDLITMYIYGEREYSGSCVGDPIVKSHLVEIATLKIRSSQVPPIGETIMIGDGKSRHVNNVIRRYILSEFSVQVNTTVID